MIKTAAFFKRTPGISVEAFADYWLNTHAGIVVRMPGIRRYVQSHTLPLRLPQGRARLRRRRRALVR